MKVTCPAVGSAEIHGYGAKIQNDQSKGSVTIYSESAGCNVTFTGKPRELRKLGRFILEGMRKPKKNLLTFTPDVLSMSKVERER